MSKLKHDWSIEEINELFALPFNDLLFKAHTIHRENFDPNKVQVSSLLNIKTGACPEDCSYCSQSAKHDSGLERERLMKIQQVKDAATKAKELGSERFCMGAAWRNPTDKSLDIVIDMIKEVKALGIEVWKVFSVGEDFDFSELQNFPDADMFLFDTILLALACMFHNLCVLGLHSSVGHIFHTIVCN